MKACARDPLYTASKPPKCFFAFLESWLVSKLYYMSNTMLVISVMLAFRWPKPTTGGRQAISSRGELFKAAWHLRMIGGLTCNITGGEVRFCHLQTPNLQSETIETGSPIIQDSKKNQVSNIVSKATWTTTGQTRLSTGLKSHKRWLRWKWQACCQRGLIHNWSFGEWRFRQIMMVPQKVFQCQRFKGWL